MHNTSSSRSLLVRYFVPGVAWVTVILCVTLTVRIVDALGFQCHACSVDLFCGSRTAGEYCQQGLTARYECTSANPHECDPQNDQCARLLVKVIFNCWYDAGPCGGNWCLENISG